MLIGYTRVSTANRFECDALLNAPESGMAPTHQLRHYCSPMDQLDCYTEPFQLLAPFRN